MTGRTARAVALGLAVGGVLAGVLPAAPAHAGPAPASAAVRAAAPLPGGLGPCIPGDCPDSWLEPHNGAIQGRDNAVNIFVGGDFRVRERAAEAEGRVIVMGGFDMAKTSGVYNIGIVGVGSRVPPPAGSDFLATGGNVSVAAGQTLLADGGTVRYAGTLTGNVTGTLENDPNAVDSYRPLAARLTAASKCYARVDGQPRPATGTVQNLGYETVLTGDNTSPLQVFNVTGNLAGARDVQQSLRFERIPAGATVLVNVLGTDPIVHTSSGVLANVTRDKLLWNFPDAETVRLIGSGQFQGATLIAEPDSETVVQLPGMNGRFFTSGSLTHTSAPMGGGGQEFHSYPFTGDLPECGSVAPTGTVSVRKVDAETGTALTGARFELWRETNGTAGLQPTGINADTRVGDECTTAADGTCAGTQEAGSYYWRETRAPEGYDLPADPVFGPLLLDPANGRDTATVTARNRAVTGAVSVVKHDAATEAALQGARFELWRETNGTRGLQRTGINADTRVVADCTTGTDGICSDTVRLGTYYWYETAAPQGYDLPADPVFGPLVLTRQNATAGVTVRAANTVTPPQPVTGEVTVVKTDTDTGAPLRGALFTLWQETNGSTGLQTDGANPDTEVSAGCATDADGRCSASVPPGTYYWQETQAPDGYDLPAAAVSAPLVLTRENAEAGVTVQARNKKTAEPSYKGSVKVVKKDAKTGRALRGAVFELWRETNGVRGLQTAGDGRDTRVDNGCATDRQGVCTYEDLPEGYYYLRETAVPEGYDLPANPVTGPLHVFPGSPDRQVTAYVKNQRDHDGKGGKDGKDKEGKEGKGKDGKGKPKPAAASATAPRR
ncbi:choice-of-anchor A family protein [Streptomyces bambusae]|uniref:SpaA isopeptide-forming pilin-related protein n=1 Tax=Streptomyces bambusae TaxID=1550616 RepID=UPI001CFE6C76|nr:choice-of-anchor A family protein [Streptomyces bambusae]MCB5166587.1 choice-of-anchor A family protein [Streptomyces bambusae]